MSHTYLIIDDSKLLHQMYQLIFSRPAHAGSRLIHAFDGKEGFAQLAAHPELRLVLLDLNMPGLTGLEFLARRRAESLHLHVPVVMVTTESSADDELRGLAAGAWAYLRKPFTPEQLEAVVARMAQQTPVGRLP